MSFNKLELEVGKVYVIERHPIIGRLGRPEIPRESLTVTVMDLNPKGFDQYIQVKFESGRIGRILTNIIKTATLQS